MITHSHITYHLMCYCLSVGKIGHILRTVPCHLIDNWIANFTTLLRSSFNQLVGFVLNDTQWMDANTPISEGGAGMTAPDEKADCAFTASFLNSTKLWSNFGRKSFRF